MFSVSINSSGCVLFACPRCDAPNFFLRNPPENCSNCGVRFVPQIQYMLISPVYKAKWHFYKMG